MSEKQNAMRKQILDATPKSQKIFGSTVYWITIFVAAGALLVPIFILANPSYNMLNPNLVFQAIFEGASPRDIWGYSAYGAFPGGHFYLRHIAMADSWAMILIAVSCGFGFLGLVPAAAYQFVKEKDRFCAVLGTIVALLILLSAIGVLNIG